MCGQASVLRGVADKLRWADLLVCMTSHNVIRFDTVTSERHLEEVFRGALLDILIYHFCIQL